MGRRGTEESERDSGSGSGSAAQGSKGRVKKKKNEDDECRCSLEETRFDDLKELRFHFSQTSQGSKGLRDCVQTNYKDLKTVNPTFPFLVRECEGIEAKIWARYELGVEKSISVEGLDVANVEKSVQQLVKEKPT